MTDYDSQGRPFTRDSEKDAKYRTGAAAASGVNRSAAGLGSANKGRPKVPQRKDYAGDKEWQAAFDDYMRKQNGDTDAVAQKRALGRMK